MLRPHFAGQYAVGASLAYASDTKSVKLCPMLLTGRNLAKSIGPRMLFSGITLGLSEGERIGLIGANGSGKSTLLRIFAGLPSRSSERFDYLKDWLAEP